MQSTPDSLPCQRHDTGPEKNNRQCYGTGKKSVSQIMSDLVLPEGRREVAIIPDNA
jgi:hypothetical protein